MRSRRGVTLAELMVTLLVLGVLAGLTAASLGSLRTTEPDPYADAAAEARRRAIRTGRPVRLDGDSGGGVLFLPDGRGIGDGVDYLTGVPHGGGPHAGVAHATR
jgi:prepilin-type N-terminal cleavage/methylation domain-containing protein